LCGKARFRDVQLALKLTLILLIVFPCALLAGIRFQRDLELEWYEQARSEDLESLAIALRSGVDLAWQSGGRAAAEAFLRAQNRQAEHELSLVRLDQLSSARGGRLLSESALSAARRGEHVFWSDRTHNPVTILSYASLGLAEEPELGLEIVSPMIDEEPYVRRSLLGFAQTTGAMTLIAVFIAAAIGNRVITRPLRRIITRARAVGAGDLSVNFGIPQGDEIGALSNELNNMVRQLAAARVQIAAETEQRVRAVEELRMSDRLATVGTLAAGVAHELGTPLHVAAGRARRIAALADVPAQARSDAEVVRAQCERMRGIVQQLLDYARRPSRTPSSVSITSSVTRITSMLDEMAQRHDARIELQLPDDELVLPVHAELFEQALTNLVVNALQAMPDGGAVTVSASRVARGADESSAASDWICVAVQDQGTGIAPELRERLFDPFFTTKEVGQGTGLGLFIAYGIVQEHGGFIEVESHQGRGSKFEIYLPSGVST